MANNGKCKWVKDEEKYERKKAYFKHVLPRGFF